MQLLINLLFSFFTVHAADLNLANVAPDNRLTPGVLCTNTDADFMSYDYPEKIARCNRNIAEPEKVAVAQKYGNIPRADWNNYEFDHLIPLCAGGSNSIENLWPQPIAEAKKKDILEVEICTAMRDGTMKQEEAVQKVHNWFAAAQANSN